MTQEEKSIELYKKLKPLLEEGNTVEIHPHGFSMWPCITSSTDSVLVQPIKDWHLRTNDILLYQRTNGLLVLHRLYQIRDDDYYFVGDNQVEVEGPINSGQILGIVTHICRKGHTFSVKNPLYRLCSRIWLILRPFRHKISRPLGKLWRLLHPQKQT